MTEGFTEEEIEKLLEMGGDEEPYVNYEPTTKDWSLLSEDFRKVSTSADTIDIEADIADAEARNKAAAEEEDRQWREMSRIAEEKQKKRIRYSPPGLKVFQRTCYRYFNRRNLSLERDLGYGRRPFLRETYGLSDKIIDDILDTPWKLVMHLSPEMTTPLIGSEDDFACVCDYLVFALTTTRSWKTAALLKKALFTLLKNYGYERWKFGLRHLVPSLLNLGMVEATLLDSDHYNGFLKTRLSEPAIRRRKFDMNAYLPRFFVDRFRRETAVSTNDNNEKSDDEAADSTGSRASLEYALSRFKLSHLDHSAADGNDDDEAGPPADFVFEDEHHLVAIRRLVSLVADLVSTHPRMCQIVPNKDSADWIDTLVTFHILATVGTDWHLIMDSGVRGDIATTFRCLLDAFSVHQWAGSEPPVDASDTKPDTRKIRFVDVNSVTNDITEALIFVGVLEGCDDIRAWNSDAVPEFDHHHNFVRRIAFLPPTFRGNAIRKMVAYMGLKQIINTDDYELIALANVSDALKLIKGNQAKLKRLHNEYYVMMSIIRLVDVIVGNEPFLDYTSSKIPIIEEVIDYFSKYQSQGLRQIQESDPARIREFISQVITKWKLLIAEAKEGRQVSLDRYIVRQKSREEHAMDTSQ